MRFVFAALLMSFYGCGQLPDFNDEPSEKRSKPGSVGALSNLSENTQSQTSTSTSTATSTDETVGDRVDTDEDPATEEDHTDPGKDLNWQIPGEVSKSDLDAVARCLKGWRNAPFSGKIENFKRIAASVTVGGTGNAVSDTERTDKPALVLIDAGVNVFGTPKYELLNPNGWYCMKVNVNVITNLTIDLHCNARLADSKVNVNVGSNQSDASAAVGVHVFSSVLINDIRPSGDRCVR